jgi:hypothetical protein
MSLIGII